MVLVALGFVCQLVRYTTANKQKIAYLIPEGAKDVKDVNVIFRKREIKIL